MVDVGAVLLFMFGVSGFIYMLSKQGMIAKLLAEFFLSCAAIAVMLFDVADMIKAFLLLSVFGLMSFTAYKLVEEVKYR